MAVPDTSVQSAKCHITETEISTWQSIWQRNDGEGGRCACLVVLKGAESITKYWTLQHLVKWWQPSSWGKGRIKPLWPITAVLFTGSTLTLFHSNNTTKSILWFLVLTIGAKGMYESYSEDGRKGRFCLFWFQGSLTFASYKLYSL